jgi:hypothetical protein
VPKPKNTRLSVFKGREAKLNRAIFQALAQKGIQTIYDVYKCVRSLKGLRCTRYGTVNKRMRALRESGYIKTAGERETRSGFEAILYELSVRAYLAILLDSIDPERLLSEIDETAALRLIAEILNVN